MTSKISYLDYLQYKSSKKKCISLLLVVNTEFSASYISDIPEESKFQLDQ